MAGACVRSWEITSTGPGGGLYKSTDGGAHWTKLTSGLPTAHLGKIGVTVSPVNTERVWATVEADEKGGVYRSDNGGQTWTLLNDDFNMTSRQYYYGHIFADPQELDTVYTFCAKYFYKSTDGGKTYREVPTPHGDYHDLWIDPHDHLRMVNGSDGGAAVTFNGGRSWTSLDNQPTAQFYTAITDNSVPYRIYGSQQDNTTVSIASRDVRRRHHRARLASSGGRRKRLHRADLVQPSGRLRRQLLRLDDALRREDRRGRAT